MMRYAIQIEVEDESFGEIVYDGCPPIPPIGSRIVAAALPPAPDGILAELEFDFREGECRIRLICDAVEQSSILPR
jgi:hypothetical protein